MCIGTFLSLHLLYNSTWKSHDLPILSSQQRQRSKEPKDVPSDAFTPDVSLGDVSGISEVSSSPGVQKWAPSQETLPERPEEALEGFEGHSPFGNTQLSEDSTVVAASPDLLLQNEMCGCIVWICVDLNYEGIIVNRST